MSTQLSILTNGTTRNYGQLNIDSGPRFYIDNYEAGPEYDIGRFHGPGWNGNAIIRRGYTGQKMVVIVRYQDTLPNAIAAWKSDRDAFAQYNSQITDNVTTWKRCTLISSDRTSEELAYGAGGVKFFTVRYLFNAEEQY